MSKRVMEEKEQELEQEEVSSGVTSSSEEGDSSTEVESESESSSERELYPLEEMEPVALFRPPIPEPQPQPQGGGRQEEGLAEHYQQLLQVVNLVGSNIKPAYLGLQSCSEELANGLNVAEVVLRKCQDDLDKLENKKREREED